MPKSGFLTDKGAPFKFSELRVVYLVLFALCFWLTEIGRFVYRPYIYSHGIDDFGIADTMGNSLGVMTQIFFMIGVLNSRYIQGIRVIGFIIVGYIAYEFAQLYLPRGTFDWSDVTATAIGGFFALIIHVSVDAVRRYFVSRSEAFKKE